LQVKPGEDATLLAAMIRVIIENAWYDRDYVRDYCSGFAELTAAVADFDLAYAEQRTTVPGEQIVEGARVFSTAASGAAQTGTGLHMAAHQNLCTQLVMTLNALCPAGETGAAAAAHVQW
jgi:anaerobic selenocysteine-containing dehydrogenase